MRTIICTKKIRDRLEEIKEDNMEAAKKQQSKSKNPTT